MHPRRDRLGKSADEYRKRERKDKAKHRPGYLPHNLSFKGEHNRTSMKIQKIREHKESLPIFQYKRIIIDKVDVHRVVIITGTSGCGLSTQVPEYIIHSSINSMVVSVQP